MASTAAAVRTAFLTIFENSALEAFTEQVYDYDLLLLLQDDLASSSYNHLMMYDGEVNFLQWVTTRTEIYKVNDIEYNYTIDMTYVRDIDSTTTLGTNYKACQDIWATVLSSIESDITHTFSNTVSGYLPQEDPVEVSLIEIDGRAVWSANFQITALA